MKIVLIHPPFYRILGFYNRYFPFGLVSLATFLKQQGYGNIQVYDADFNDRPAHIDYAQLPEKYPQYLASFQHAEHPVWCDVAETLRKLDPDIVGISIWTTFAAASFFTARLVKRMKPECPTVMGGPHATVKADEILRICPEVDYVIQGEGEYPFLELVKSLEAESSDIQAIPGVSHRHAGNILQHAPRSAAIDLNQIPYPDRLLLMRQEHYTSEDMGLILATRGCPYSCTYCAATTKRVSFRSAEHIGAEIQAVKHHYGTAQFTFKDDALTVNRQIVEVLCHTLIQEKVRINWECNTRVNLVDEPLLRLMKQAGCNFIKVGIESGSQRILTMMHKNITPDQVRRAAKLFRTVGIHWTGYFMIGIPEETEEDIRKTLDFLHEIRPDFACIGVYEPFPGTAMFTEGIQRGLIKPEMTLNEFYTTLPNHYYKQDPRRQTDRIEPERFRQIEATVKEVVRAYNRHWRRVLKMAQARTGGYRNHPGMAWNDLKKFLSY